MRNTDSKEVEQDEDRSNSDTAQSGSPRYNLRIVIFCLAGTFILMLIVHVYARYDLRDAIAKGKIGRVRILLPLAGKSGINSTNWYGYGPMQLAAQYGHKDMLELLIKHGGDVNLRKQTSWNTPLIMAASRGHTDCCRFLLDEGADPNEVGYFGGTKHTALQSTARADIWRWSICFLVVASVPMKSKDLRPPCTRHVGGTILIS